MPTILVNSGDNLQTKIDSSSSGDILALQAGATFTGQFTPKSGITITTNIVLPSRRIAPLDSLAKIVSGSSAPAIVLTGKSGVTIDGIDFGANTAGEGEVIQINGSDSITIDRCRLVLTGNAQQKRFVLGNGTNITFKRCYVSGQWKNTQDSQAFCAYNGAGPYTIQDNYLETASENILFGGADPVSAAHIPQDILIEDNYCTKLESWRNDNTRQVKNLLELKCAIGVIIRNNVFDKNWGYDQGGSQPGFAILFTPRNQDNTAPFATIDDVLFENNIISDSQFGIQIAGYDDVFPSQQATNIVIKNNLIRTTVARAFQLSNEIGTLTIEHNTYINGNDGTGYQMMYLLAEGTIKPPDAPSGRAPNFTVNNLTVKNNMLHGCDYGVQSTVGSGNAALSARVITLTWLANVVASNFLYGATYPVGETFHPTLSEYATQFNSSYLLVPESVYNDAGSDDLDLGWAGLSESNEAPTVSITSPASGTVYTAPASINLAATAADADGVVSSVAFFNGSTQLHNDTSSPYTYSWTSVPAGIYTVTAKATDDDGAQTTSTPITLIVNAAPSGSEPPSGEFEPVFYDYTFLDEQRRETKTPELAEARDPLEISAVRLIWDNELDGETIVSIASVSVTPPAQGITAITEDSVARTFTDSTTIHWLSGGGEGKHKLIVKITTSGGRTIKRSLIIPVRIL